MKRKGQTLNRTFYSMGAHALRLVGGSVRRVIVAAGPAAVSDLGATLRACGLVRADLGTKIGEQEAVSVTTAYAWMV